MKRLTNLWGLAAFFFLSLVMLGSSCNNAAQKSKAEVKTADKRPNIIYIMADDHTTQAISAYNKRYAKYFPTPNIDRIANEGIRFDRVYCANAICGPSRAIIITGKYSNENGYYKNEHGGHFNPNQWTFPQEFHNHGYTTAMLGKWHLGTAPGGRLRNGF